MAHLEEIASNASARLRIEKEICDKYFGNFCYAFKSPQVKGLTTFFHLLHQEGFLDDPVDLSFFETPSTTIVRSSF
jgi:predicted solute-binding protein